METIEGTCVCGFPLRAVRSGADLDAEYHITIVGSHDPVDACPGCHRKPLYARELLPAEQTLLLNDATLELIARLLTRAGGEGPVSPHRALWAAVALEQARRLRDGQPNHPRVRLAEALGHARLALDVTPNATNLREALADLIDALQRPDR